MGPNDEKSSYHSIPKNEEYNHEHNHNNDSTNLKNDDGELESRDDERKQMVSFDANCEECNEVPV